MSGKQQSFPSPAGLGAGSSGGGGGLPTFGAWATVDATLKFSADPNELSLTPVLSGVVYDPRFEYVMMSAQHPTGTWGALGALPSIIELLPLSYSLQGDFGEGGGLIADPANGLISFHLGGTVGATGDISGGPTWIGSGGSFGGPGGSTLTFSGMQNAGGGIYAFRSSDGALCTMWPNNGGGNDVYYVTFARQVQA